ncbi:MAG: hypothetical protein WBD58_08160 [Geitlerinemataceae cyanobacterium]
MAQTPLQPLSIGNVVSAAFRLYRDRFASYLGIAIRASLWALAPFLAILPIPLLFIFGQAELSILWIVVPIWLLFFFWCWAKSIVNSALISRLAFGILANKPETVQDARRQIAPKQWTFLWSATLTILIVYGILIAFYAAIFVLGLIAGSILGTLAILDNIIVSIILGIVAIVVGIAALVFLIRVVMRFCIVEVPLAIENKLTATQTIGRSWTLTQGSINRILGIFFIGGLISLPLQIVASVVGSLSQTILSQFLEIDPTSGLFIATNFIVSYIVGIILGAVLIPLWQSIKATIYYDLRSRKEGLDLQLRDR